jgi:hypothetical protein
MKIQKSINMKLPDFRVRMEKSDYYPGEIVRGLLVLNVGTPLSANQVYVKLFGYTETHWTEQHTGLSLQLDQTGKVSFVNLTCW